MHPRCGHTKKGKNQVLEVRLTFDARLLALEPGRLVVLTVDPLLLAAFAKFATVPARSSYNLLRSSTEAFLRPTFLGSFSMPALTEPEPALTDPTLDMRCSKPGLGVRGLGT